MKRYSVAKTFSGKTCGIWQFIERDDGEWVKYDEAEKIRNDLGVRIQRGKLIVERLLATLADSCSEDGILDARIEEGMLKVVSAPSLKKLRIPVSNIPELRNSRRADLERIDIDEDGGFIYWPKLDVHLGWEGLLHIASPMKILRREQENKKFNKRYGGAIRAIRKEYKIPQAKIKGLTSRQVSRIEKGECRATSSALEKLAVAHGLTTNEYLEKLAQALCQP